MRKATGLSLGEALKAGQAIMDANIYYSGFLAQACADLDKTVKSENR